MMAKRLFFMVLLLVFVPASSLGQMEGLRDSERVESFHVRISILPQGEIELTETIILVNHGDRVSWGFERVLPRWRQTDLGHERALDYDILEVLVDGEPLEYCLADTGDGLAVTVGDPTLTLPPGRYVYILSYRCAHALDFYDFSQGLDWNATGVWPLPMERVAVDLEFARAPRPGFTHWDAVVGSESREGWRSTLEEKDWLRFETIRPLTPGESMIVTASWPQGYAQHTDQVGGILDCSSRAKLGSDRLLSVEEQLRLRNDGSFSQGFSRDFPNLNLDGEGRRRISHLNITQVLVDGVDFPWAQVDIPGGQRLQVGNTENPLPSREFILTIAYTLDRQVAVGQEFEELNWQMPGFPWRQSIGQVKFTLELPAELTEVQPLRSALLRGENATSSNVFHYDDYYGRIVFAAAGPLSPGEELACAVGWPKGLLPAVALTDEGGWWLRDNASAVATMVILVFLLGLTIVIASRRGSLPWVEASSPPDKCSPALLRYLRLGSYDNRGFTAAILSLAVKGSLMIVEEEGNYALVSSGIRSFLPADEEALTKTLFQKRQAVFPAKDGALFRAARRAHRHSLSGQAKALLRRRRGWFYAIAGLTLLAAVYSGWLLPASLAVRLGLVGFALWAAVLAWVALRTWVLLPALVDEKGAKSLALILVTELVVVGAITYLWGDWLAPYYGLLTLIALLSIAGLLAVLSRVLLAPTPQGREILAQTQGFRDWLLQKERPGGPARFEKFLPHATALDAVNRWGRRFGMPKRQGSFSPSWYQGSRWHTINAETLAASLSLLPRVQDRD